MNLWSEVQYRLVNHFDEVDNYAAGLKSVYHNGKVNHWIFEAADADKFDSAVCNDREASPGHELRAFFRWLSLGAVKNELDFDEPPRVVELGGFACEGILTQLLCDGGAYARFNSDEITRARQLSFACMTSLFGSELNRVRAFVTYDYWCKWFHDSGWDVAIFALEKSRRRWWILCATDFD